MTEFWNRDSILRRWSISMFTNANAHTTANSFRVKPPEWSLSTWRTKISKIWSFMEIPNRLRIRLHSSKLTFPSLFVSNWLNTYSWAVHTKSYTNNAIWGHIIVGCEKRQEVIFQRVLLTNLLSNRIDPQCNIRNLVLHRMEVVVVIIKNFGTNGAIPRRHIHRIVSKRWFSCLPNWAKYTQVPAR